MQLLFSSILGQKEYISQHYAGATGQKIYLMVIKTVI